MNESTRKRLRDSGARVTNVQEFLGLSDDETALIEMKVALAKKLREVRQSAKITQTQAAVRVGSSQSRVAKMEGGDPGVSLDLLVGALLKLGASAQVVGRTIEGVTTRKSRTGASASPSRRAAAARR